MKKLDGIFDENSFPPSKRKDSEHFEAEPLRSDERSERNRRNLRRRPTDVMFRNVKKKNKASGSAKGSHRLSELYFFQNNFKQ